MEQTSLHPLDPEIVRRFVSALNDGDASPLLAIGDAAWATRVVETARRGYATAKAGDESGANAVTYGLARLLAARHPSFFQAGISLTTWEARFDRGAGMLLRPPARLFIEEGLDVYASRTMPIRLDFGRGLMGGCFVPARLVPDFEKLLNARIERIVRRLIDAELDGVAVMGLMLEGCAYARARGLGLFEGVDVVVPEEPASIPPGGQVVLADKKRLDPALRQRLEAAAKPPKKPGLVARLLGRGGRPAAPVWPETGERGDGR
ncbi:MAG: hypothetical protein ACRDJW_00190 [Thermomicrobiales bacterium]